MSDERASMIEQVEFDIDGIRIDCVMTDAVNFIAKYCTKYGYERDMSIPAAFNVRTHYDDTTISLKFNRFETDKECEARKKKEKASILADKVKHEKDLERLNKLATKLGKKVI